MILDFNALAPKLPMRRYPLRKAKDLVSIGRLCINTREFLALLFSATAILAHVSSLNSYAQTNKIVALEWGVVLGADKNPGEAAKEVADNKKILGQAPRMYLCNGWVRTVAVFERKQDALNALRKARAAGSRYSPYIVSMGQWCPGKKRL